MRLQYFLYILWMWWESKKNKENLWKNPKANSEKYSEVYYVCKKISIRIFQID